MFHRHKWIEQERFYAPPVNSDFKARRVTSDFIERLEFGVTSIKFVCEECGNIKVVEILGKKMN